MMAPQSGQRRSARQARHQGQVHGLAVLGWFMTPPGQRQAGAALRSSARVRSGQRVGGAGRPPSTMAATPMPRPAMATMPTMAATVATSVATNATMATTVPAAVPARGRMIVITVAGGVLAGVAGARTGVGTRAGAGLADVADLHWRSGRRALAAGCLQPGCAAVHRLVRLAVQR